MAITTLSMVLTVFVLNLHHISDRPVPNWARKVILIYLARALVMCTAVDRQENDNNANRSRPQNNKYRRHFRSSYTGFDNDEEETSAIIELHQKGKAKTENDDLEPKEEEGCFGNSNADGFESPWVLRHSPRHQRHVQPQLTGYSFHRQVSPQTEYYKQLQRQPEPRSPNYYVRYQMELRASNFGLPRHGDVRTPGVGNRPKGEPRTANNHVRCVPATDDKPQEDQRPQAFERDRPKPPDYSKEWTRVAEIFDRLFFWLFLFAILITTLVLFHPLTKSYIKQTDDG